MQIESDSAMHQQNIQQQQSVQQSPFAMLKQYQQQINNHSQKYYTEIQVISASWYYHIQQYFASKWMHKEKVSNCEQKWKIDKLAIRQVDDQHFVITFAIKQSQNEQPQKCQAQTNSAEPAVVEIHIIQMGRIFKVLVKLLKRASPRNEKKCCFEKIDSFWFSHSNLLRAKMQNHYRLSSLISDRPYQKSQFNHIFLERLYKCLSLHLDECGVDLAGSLPIYRQFIMTQTANNHHQSAIIQQHKYQCCLKNDKYFLNVLSCSALPGIIRFLSLPDILKLLYSLSWTARSLLQLKLAPQSQIQGPENLEWKKKSRKQKLQLLAFKTLYDLEFGKNGFELNQINWPKIFKRKRAKKK